MGNQKSEFQERFSNNYGFIEALQDPIYGLVKIYRKKFENYHYVMVIDRRLQEFNNHTFMADCIRPANKMEISPLRQEPKFLINQNSQTNSIQFNSLKLQKLKRTLELIKRYQDELMIPFFSYQIVNGNKLQCIEPVIHLYVQFHNHRLSEYLQVLRVKSLQLKVKQIIYILKTVALALMQLEKMQIEVTSKQVNIHTIFTSNEGQIKLHPIEILTKKQHERENLSNIENLKIESSSNSSIYNKKIALGKSLRSSSSAVQKKSSDGGSGFNYLKEKDILFSSNESLSANLSKLANHRQILRKLLIQLSAFSFLKHSQSKDLQSLNMILTKSYSLNEISQNLQKYGKPGLQGLLVQRIYDFEQNQNKVYQGSTVTNNERTQNNGRNSSHERISSQFTVLKNQTDEANIKQSEVINHIHLNQIKQDSGVLQHKKFMNITTRNQSDLLTQKANQGEKQNFYVQQNFANTQNLSGIQQISNINYSNNKIGRQNSQFNPRNGKSIEKPNTFFQNIPEDGKNLSAISLRNESSNNKRNVQSSTNQFSFRNRPN